METKYITIAVTIIGIAFFLALTFQCGNQCQVIKAEVEKVRIEAEAKAKADIEIKKLEAEKAKHEAEASKPESVRLEELKAKIRKEELEAQRKHELELADKNIEAARASKPAGATDGLGEAAGWAAGAYVGGKIIEGMTK